MEHDWDGQPLGGALVALIQRASDDMGPMPVFAAGQRCIVRPEQLGEFLRVHRGAFFVSHDVGPLFWTLSDHLRSTSEQAALGVLWDLAREGRLHDVTLLDQLIRAAEGSSRPREATLCEQAERHLGITLGDEDEPGERPAGPDGGRDRPGVQPHLDEACRLADAVLGVYRVLRESADGITRKHGIDRTVIERFGPLALNLQVRGAIALAAAGRNGLYLDEDSRRDVVRACNATHQACLAALWGDDEARLCFQRDGDGPKLSKSGFPQFRAGTLEAWLKKLGRELICLHSIPFLPPTQADGRISSDPSDWGPWAGFRPLLREWADLTATASLRRCFDQHRGDRLHPRYRLLPTIRSVGPDLQQLHRHVRPGVFRPGPRHVFLVVTLRDLELRALAAACAATRAAGPYQDDYSPLLELLRRGDDPRLNAAARLLYLSVEGYAALEFRGPDRHLHGAKLANMLLDVAPTGVEPDLLRVVARPEFGIDPIPVAITFGPGIKPHFLDFGNLIWTDEKVVRIEGAFRKLIRFIYPELYRYLRDDGWETLVINLGITAGACADRFGLTNQFAATSMTALRKLLLNEVPDHPNPDYLGWSRKVWRILRELVRDGRRRALVEEGHGSPALYVELMGRDVVTPAGRVLGRLCYHEARGLIHTTLADDAAKAALFAVVEAGYRLVGHRGAEFVLEIPAWDVVEASRIEVGRLAGGAAGAVLGSIPVPCTAEPRDRW